MQQEIDDDGGWGPPVEVLPSPWPELGELLHLSPGHFIGIGAAPGSREAEVGYDLALHAAAHGVRALLFAPSFPARNPVPNLTIQRRPTLSPETVEQDVASFAHLPDPVGLVVIDHFHLMTPVVPEPRYTDDPMDDPEDTQPADQAADTGRRLKMLAVNAAYHKPTVVVMARITPPADSNGPLALEHLGLAAELVYDTDTLLLLNRTTDTMDVHIAKDRFGPAPTRTTIRW
ncbi:MULTISPECIES: hypothetical protein [Streptomyces]|uniref:SF4 helicase domain-containing protein n=1 Tax=Streptomyces demainii TaxID=588122 RepID=A0ABT9KK00_9ACTN|nr:hypothetical protein [Streptomyces demainii]MDP9607806.1 hypothetical protein [Streptomyces demainii]